MKRLYIIIIIFTLAITLEAKNNISGYVQAFDYIDISGFLEKTKFCNNSCNDYIFSHDRTGAKLQIRLNGDFLKNVYYDVSFNLDYDSKLAQREPVSRISDGIDLSFKEAFISIKNIYNFMDLKIGRQFLFWGPFEWGSSLDVITPWNFTNMSAEKENFRISLDLAKISMNFTDFMNLDLIYVPIAVQNRVAIPNKLGPFAREASIHQSKSIVDSDIALKLNFLFDDTDITLHYFKGSDRNFSIIVEPIKGSFHPEYKKLQVAGMSFSTILFDMTFLGEFSYHHTEDSKGDDIMVTNRNINAGFGIEKDLTSKLSLSAQFTYKRYLNYNRQKEYDTFTSFMPDPYVKRTNIYSILYRFRYMYSEKINFQLLNNLNFKDFNMMLLSFASINPRENIKIYIGTIVFKGKKGTRFGRIEQESRFFIELKYLF